LHVLLADNEPRRAASVAFALQQAGVHRLSRPEPGEPLIEAVLRLGPDVVIVNMQRPDRDALDGVRHVSERKPRPIVGRTVALTLAIWPNHPEKCFAVRADWAEANRSALDGLLRALRPAGLACDDAANTPALAELLAGPDWVGVPAPLIAASLPGGSGAESDRSIFAAHHAMIPDPGAGRWFLEQIALRWPVPEKADTVVRINGARQWR
jgi:CheY-like chemotaxis protein